MPITAILRALPLNRCANGTFTVIFEIDFLTSSTSSSAYARFTIRVKISVALAYFALETSHRGLSGTIKASIKYIIEGKTGAQNIHLQPIWPFHELRISSPGITGRAISQLAI